MRSATIGTARHFRRPSRGWRLGAPSAPVRRRRRQPARTPTIEPFDLDGLAAGWSSSFEAAQAALRAAAGSLGPEELGACTRRLAAERIATVQLLELVARELHTESVAVGVLASGLSDRG